MSNPTELTSIEQILTLPDGGTFLADLMDRHSDLIADLSEHQNAFGGAASGKMTITLGYTLDRLGNLNMTAAADIKKPKQPPAKAIAWTTAEGGITPNNPNQMRMDLRDADTGTPSDVRDAG